MSSFTKLDFPKLPEKLREDLGNIIPSMDRDLTYRPCATRLSDGTVLCCVYVVPEGPYIKHWGVNPQHDRGKSYISISDVDALAESPSRLPAKFANKLYKNGESGMGYTIFTVVFADGSRQAYGKEMLSISFAIQMEWGRMMSLKFCHTRAEMQNWCVVPSITGASSPSDTFQLT